VELVYANMSNRHCADCSAPAPEWASVNFIVTLCHQCAGVTPTCLSVLHMHVFAYACILPVSSPHATSRTLLIKKEIGTGIVSVTTRSCYLLPFTFSLFHCELITYLFR